MEKLEILNQQMNKTGKFKERSLLHKDGDYHAVIRVYMMRVVNGKIQTLLQKRSESCEAFPGFYDIACAGHIQGKDTPLETLFRELKEELGVSVKKEEITLVGHDFMDWSRNEYLDREFSYLYLIEKDPVKFVLQKEEVAEVKWVEVEELLPCLDDSIMKYCILRREMEMVIRKYQEIKKERLHEDENSVDK